jgi:5-formyltetrahydrofolate cyclo-ligase
MKREKLKKVFRKESIGRLKKIAKRSTYKKDKTIVAKLYASIKKEKAQDIMMFLPLKMEVNLFPLIKQLRKEKKHLYVPFMEGASFRLVKYRLPLRKKQFGIKEPIDSKQYKRKKIDMALVPIVGFDKTFRRIGFGKGMYDRFFAREEYKIKKVIFVTREVCFSQEIITDDYDVQAHSIVSA